MKQVQGRILGVILAGGRGERLGRRDKALIEWRGAPLIVHVTRALSPQVDELVIARQADQSDLAGYGRVLTDLAPDQGPLSAVITAAEYALANGFDFIVTAAVDSPAIPADLVARLMAARAPHAVLASRLRMQPTFALYDLARFDAIKEAFAAGVRAPKRALASAGVGQAIIDAPIFNINTAADLVQIDGE